MAKQVTIKKMTLINFKGMRTAAIDFDGSETTISGRNGTGKTTIFDAFNWLFFGKDSAGNSDTKFGIKTNDKNGAFIPHLTHEVNGTLEVTDTETGESETKVFRRVLVEEWKDNVDAETGESNKILKGHHTNYYYNGMPMKTKQEYDRLVAEVVSESVFRFITSPSYFLTQHWQMQRDILLQLAGEITDEEIMASDSKFAKLAELLQGKTLEGYQAMIKEDKAKIEEDLKRIPTRIDEVMRNTPQPLDFTALEAQLKELKDEQEKIAAAITSAAEANRQEYDKKQSIQIQINSLRLKQQDALHTAQRQANEDAYKRNAEYDAVQAELTSLESTERNSNAVYTADMRRIETDKKRAEQRAEEYTHQQNNIRNRWFEVNAEEFKEEENLICPLFKHRCADSDALTAYNQNRRNAQERFMEDKQMRLADITKQGKQLGEQITAQHNEIARLSAEMQEVQTKHENDTIDIQAKRTSLNDKLKSAQKVTAPTLRGEDVPEWETLQAEIDTLSSQLATDAQPGQATDAVMSMRRQFAEVSKKVDDIKQELQKKEWIEKSEQRIAELDEMKKQLQQAKAQLQGKNDLLEAFERTKMEEVERRVNVMFNLVSFKMYRQQIEGGKQVPDCVCYIDGVRYADTNNAGKINAGLDVINALCKFHKVNAPIFIDNAESVNEFIPVTSQLIKLVVTKGNLTIRNS